MTTTHATSHATTTRTVPAPTIEDDALIDGAADGAADALAERLFGEAIGAIDLFTAYLGLRLGLYRALEESPGSTPDQMAAPYADRFALDGTGSVCYGPVDAALAALAAARGDVDLAAERYRREPPPGVTAGTVDADAQGGQAITDAIRDQPAPRPVGCAVSPPAPPRPVSWRRRRRGARR